MRMNPSTLVIWSQVTIFAGAVLMACGGFGAFHFSKKVDLQNEAKAQAKEDSLNKKIESLIAGNKQLQSGNDELKSTLEPFKAYAVNRFPDADVGTSLKKLEDELKRIDVLTTPTAYKVSSYVEIPLPDGKFRYDVTGRVKTRHCWPGQNQPPREGVEVMKG
jgi:hypothetical protein